MAVNYANRPIEHKIRHQENRIRKLNKQAKNCFRRGQNTIAVQLLNMAYKHERILESLTAA